MCVYCAHSCTYGVGIYGSMGGPPNLSKGQRYIPVSWMLDTLTESDATIWLSLCEFFVSCKPTSIFGFKSDLVFFVHVSLIKC